MVYIQDVKDLQYVVDQWHPYKNRDRTPANVSTGSGIKFWWLDEHGHEWQASPLARITQTQGCPYCTGNQVLVGFNDLVTTQPKLAKDWHPTKNGNLLPTQISAYMNRSVWWLGKDCAHEWEAAINSRSRGNNCPYCGNRKVLAGFNDLGSSLEYAHVVAEWHPTKNLPLLVSEVSVKANKKVWWLCQEGHEWEAIIANRTANGSGCPTCRKNSGSSTLVLVSTTDLANEWSPTNTKTASEVTAGSAYLATWVCEKDSRHVWKVSVASRRKGSGCPVCTNQKIITGINDFASSIDNQVLLKEWHPDNTVSPSEIGVGYDKSVKWKCVNNHEWSTSVYNRVQKRNGCPECIGRTKQPDNKLKVSDYPALVSQWHPDNQLDMNHVSFRSAKQAKWVCSKNSKHIWTASIQSRSLDGSDCPVCAGRIIIKGVNDLSAYIKFAYLVKEWHPDNSFTPYEVSYSSNRIAQWQCQKNVKHTWFTTVAARTHVSNPSGCPECAMALSSSKGEEEVNDVLTLLGFDAVRNTRNVVRSELDMYLPNEKFAVEYNGLYWHSDAIREDKFYHAKKAQACKDAGVELYNIWEDDWQNKREIVIRNLAERLHVMDKLKVVLPNIPTCWTETLDAGNTTVEVVSTTDARNFLDKHHLQGFVSGQHYIGLYDALRRLRAIMVLSSTNTMQELRIDRYATAGSIVGGFAKILSHAESTLDVLSWVTTIDLAITTGDLYVENGFVLAKTLPVDYSYLVRSKRAHKLDYQVKRFREDKDLLYQDDMTEKELAHLNSLHRIWDFGKQRYTKQITLSNK